MKNWTVTRRISAAIALIVLIGAVTSAVIYQSIRTLSVDVRETSQVWSPSVNRLNFVNGALDEGVVALLENFSTTDEAESQRQYKRMNERLQSVEAALTAYKTDGMITEEMGEGALYDKSMSTFQATKALTKQAADLALANKNSEAREIYFRDLRPLIDATTDAVDAQIKLNEDMLTKTADHGLAMANRAQSVALIGGIISMLIGAALAVILVRGLNQVLGRVASTLGDASSQLTAAAGQVSASSQSLAEGASEQAASLEETSASLEEIGAMARRNAEGAGNAKTIADQANHVTETGSQQMGEMVGAMSAIKESSDNIAKIIKTIDEIAFQTNILALNAAVEAARAGEAGAGFAVVADEVRALAQRAAQAAKETSDKINDTIEKSGRGTELSTRVSGSLVEITDKTRQVNGLVESIATASSEQNQGLSQVSAAITQMDKVTQSNASTAEEVAAAAEELNAQSNALLEVVGQLNSLVGLRNVKAVSSVSAPAVASLHTASHSAPAKPVLHRPQVASLVVKTRKPAVAAVTAGMESGSWH